MPDKPLFATDPFHHIVKNLGENADDAIAVIVGVAIVELLEVVQIGVAHRELRLQRDARGYRRLDLDGARQSGGWMNDEITIRSPQECIKANDLLRHREILEHDFVRSRIERGGEALFSFTAENHGGNDARIGVVLEPSACLVDRLGIRSGIEGNKTRTAPKRYRHKLVDIVDGEHGVRPVSYT